MRERESHKVIQSEKQNYREINYAFPSTNFHLCWILSSRVISREISKAKRARNSNKQQQGYCQQCDTTFNIRPNMQICRARQQLQGKSIQSTGQNHRMKQTHQDSKTTGIQISKSAVNHKECTKAKTPLGISI